MDTDLGMPIINKEPKTGYAESLAGYTKSILFKIGDTTNIPLKKSYKKDQIAEVLKDELLDQLRGKESDLTEKDWELLRHSADEKIQEVSREDLPSYTNLAEHGYVFVFRKGVAMELTVPEEIIEILNESEKSAEPSSKENSRELDENETALLQLYENTKRIYGAANLTYLTKVWNDRHEMQFTVDEVKALVQNSE